jgi:DNA-binding response OmpR family regulator
VVQAESGEVALDALAEFAFDIVVTDLRLPGIDGTAVIEAAVERYPEIIGIVITGYGTVRDAVEVIKRGAADFVTKPFQFDELRHALDGAIEQRRLKSENAWLAVSSYNSATASRHRRPQPDDARSVSDARDRRADGEHDSDHGRDRNRQEVVARAIHHASPRRGQAVRRAQLQRDSRRTCSKPRSSGTCAARSRAPSAPGRAGSNRRIAARCSSTKSGR